MKLHILLALLLPFVSTTILLPAQCSHSEQEKQEIKNKIKQDLAEIDIAYAEIKFVYDNRETKKTNFKINTKFFEDSNSFLFQKCSNNAKKLMGLTAGKFILQSLLTQVYKLSPEAIATSGLLAQYEQEIDKLLNECECFSR